MIKAKPCWTDASVEGKILRHVFCKLYQNFKKTENEKDKIRLSHAMRQVAIAKNNLAKTNELEQRLRQVEEKLGL